MAKAIRSIPAHADQTVDAELEWEQIKQVAVENREGVQQAIRILGLLGDKGILDAMTALVEKGEEVLQVALRQANQPDSMNGVSNFVALTQAFAQMDVAGVPRLLRGLGEGARLAQSDDGISVHGAWDVWKALRDEDVSKGLSNLLTMLKGLGRS